MTTPALDPDDDSDSLSCVDPTSVWLVVVRAEDNTFEVLDTVYDTMDDAIDSALDFCDGSSYRFELVEVHVDPNAHNAGLAAEGLHRDIPPEKEVNRT